MNYIEVQVTTSDAGQREILIALLADKGFEGFEETDTALKAFIRQDEFNKINVEEIISPLQLACTSSMVPAQNWNADWESSFEPVIINDFAAIRASFHSPVKNVKHEMIITPKMSFGTGHHATTFLMISRMAELDLEKKTVLDFGTGTAVLSILAEKMGAIAVDAIDNDEWSIENSKENITANHCTHIALHKADAITPDHTYDIILANINLNVIVSNLEAITAAAKKGGAILLSGFLKDDEPALVAALNKHGITLVQTSRKGEWICLLANVN